MTDTDYVSGPKPTYDTYVEQHQIQLLEAIADELEIEYEPLPWDMDSGSEESE